MSPVEQPSSIHPLTGPLRWRAASPASRAPVELLDDWAARHLVELDLPPLRGKPQHRPGEPGPGRPHAGRVRLHRDVASQFAAALAEVEREGLLGLITSVGEDFAPRLQAGRGGAPTGRLSAHALGLALDLNPEHGGWRDHTPSFEEPGSLRALAPLFARHGLRWGGWEPGHDNSHFEAIEALPPGVVRAVTAKLVLAGETLGGVPASWEPDGYVADPRALAARLGGTAEPLARGDASARVRGPGATVELPVRWRGTVPLVPLEALLAAFGRRPAPQPGGERIDVITD